MLLEAKDIRVSFRKENQTRLFGRERQEVLHGLSIDLKEGECLGIIGESGSGKSTLAKLLVHYYDIGGGKITLGGQDITDMSLDALNARISFVSQDNFLFNESVRENIRKGNLAATDEEVENIAKALSLIHI